MSERKERLQAFALRAESALSRVYRCVPVRAAVFCVLLCVIAAIVFLLNSHTPLMMDDFDYSISWSTGERLDGVADIVRSQAAHYMLWGGRSVVHFFAQLFLYWGKGVFDVANTVFYLLLLLEIYAIAKPKEARFCWPILLAAHAALFFCVPFFGTVFLWLDGACNYLLGTLLALLPLLIARSAWEGGVFSGGWRIGVFVIVLSFFAGWTNENTACAVLAVCVLWLLLSVVQGRKVQAWRYAALGAQALGTAVMLIAPGNYARAAAETGRSLLVEYAYRIAVVAVYTLAYIGLFLAAMLLLVGLCRALRIRARSGYALLLLFCALLCAFALIASPVISDRSFTAVIVLALCGMLVLLGDAEAAVRAFDAPLLCAAPVLLMLLVFGGYGALSDVKTHEEQWLAQQERIEQAAALGQTQVEVRSVLSHSPYTMDIRLEESASQWPNSTMSKYFGVEVNAH